MQQHSEESDTRAKSHTPLFEAGVPFAPAQRSSVAQTAMLTRTSCGSQTEGAAGVSHAPAQRLSAAQRTIRKHTAVHKRKGIHVRCDNLTLVCVNSSLCREDNTRLAPRAQDWRETTPLCCQHGHKLTTWYQQSVNENEVDSARACVCVCEGHSDKANYAYKHAQT